MKRLLCVLLTVLFWLTAGCQSVGDPAQSPDVSLAPQTTPHLAPPSPSPSVSPPDVPGDPGGPEDTPIPLDAGDDGALDHFLSAFGGDAESGYIADTEADVAAQIAEAGVYGVKTLSADGLTDTALYTFTADNIGPVAEEHGLFAARLLYDSADYLVIFGNAGLSPYEEALLYYSEGADVTYYAAAVSENVLIPIIAGSDYDGFWAVRPVLAYMGFDVSGMYSLLGGGDYDGDMVDLSLTGYEAGGDSSRVYYEFLNNCPFGVTSAEETFILNGEDVSGSTFGYFEADAYSTRSDYLHIMDVRIVPGDVLEISMDLFSEDLDNLGFITFTFRFE